MYRYILKRVLFLIPTVLGVVFIIFLVMSFTPGDPARALLGVSAPQADVDALNHELGYDLPFLQKYFNYIKKMIVDRTLEHHILQNNLFLMKYGQDTKLQ